jgi:hypothetical protein
VRWVNKRAHRVTNLWDTKLPQAPLHNSVYRGSTSTRYNPWCFPRHHARHLQTAFSRHRNSQSIVDGNEKFLKQSVRQTGYFVPDPNMNIIQLQLVKLPSVWARSSLRCFETSNDNISYITLPLQKWQHVLCVVYIEVTQRSLGNNTKCPCSFSMVISEELI